MTTSKATNIVWHEGDLSREERWYFLGTRGATVWFTGLPASGKSTIASAVERSLVQGGRPAFRLDGDNIRHGLNNNLGFSKEDREENIRRIGEVSRLFAESGAIALTAFISPYVADRQRAREAHEAAGLHFFEVFVDAPLAVCEERDPKGQYRKARQGVIRGFTGVDDPYEAPRAPELVLPSAEWKVERCVGEVVAMLERHDFIRTGS